MSVLKTYGVTGLVEWNTVIEAGKARMRVVFSGGALTAYGTTPATFATRNTLVQNIIENSNYYKEGRIKLLSAHGEPDKKATTENEVEKLAPEIAEGGEQVDVTCLDDAKDYLREKYGVCNIRTKADAIKAASEKGFVFVGL